jgi:hypothetical protein
LQGESINTVQGFCKNIKAIMVVDIKQLLMIAVVTVLYTKSSTQPMSLPNCLSKCGSITIPYPFGTTKDCSLDNTFLIDCNQTYSTSTYAPFLRQSNQSVLNIALDGELHVAWPIASDCYTEEGELASTTLQSFSMTYFHISPTRNKLIAVGCGAIGLFSASDSGGNDYTTGCVAFCNSRNDFVDNQSCSGTGCCEISIPQGHVPTVASYGCESLSNHSSVHDFNPCGYTFLVENGSYSFSRTDLKLKKKEFPVVLDWAVGNQTCQQSKKNHSSHACNANSTCYDVGTDKSDGGYLCRCFVGYRGNPYLHHDGCQGIIYFFSLVMIHCRLIS